MHLGLRPSSFDFIYEAPALLKRDLLYFDQIHICSQAQFNIFGELESTDPEFHEFIQKELEPAWKAGLLFNFNLSEVIGAVVRAPGFDSKDVDGTAMRELEFIILKLIDSPRTLSEDAFPQKYNAKKARQVINEYVESVNKAEAESTRIASIFLNHFSVDDAYPLLQKQIIHNTNLPFRTSKVLEIVLEKLPVPDDNVSWQQIIDYRSDPNTRQKFLALRIWMQEVARTDYSKKEIEERFEHHMLEYENHLKLHELKFKHGKLRILVTTTAEILESLFQLKFSKISETLFSLNEKKYDLLEAEINAPGKEIAYISKANKSFKRV